MPELELELELEPEFDELFCAAPGAPAGGVPVDFLPLGGMPVGGLPLGFFPWGGAPFCALRFAEELLVAVLVLVALPPHPARRDPASKTAAPTIAPFLIDDFMAISFPMK